MLALRQGDNRLQEQLNLIRAQGAFDGLQNLTIVKGVGGGQIARGGGRRPVVPDRRRWFGHRLDA